jgi:heparan-alpha-glucosaminide N-acetyltransferase
MTKRLLSIDIFRALTMLLMIFVNDLWTLHGIPGWLEHTSANADGMGLADTVFPAFLFIVGLSIPFALGSRLSRGDSTLSILQHIATRSLALVVMGFFMVNQESFGHQVPEGFRTAWEIAMILAFLLIWNKYENKKILGKIPVRYVQLLGILILVILALLYKGGSGDSPHWMRPRWWGILGLIGWAYFVCALIYLFSQKRLGIIIIAWIVLLMFNMMEVLPFFDRMPHFILVVSASNHALVMSGVLIGMIYQYQKNRNNNMRFEIVLLLIAVLCISYGFVVRPFGGISKIMATPSWTAICAGISMGIFLLVFIVADVLHHTRWANWLLPGGQSTLTCYLLPGLLYPILLPLQKLLPAVFLGGLPGLVKSLLFAFLTIVITGWLQKIHIQLKI